MDAAISSTSASSVLPADVLARLAQKGSVRTFPRHTVLIHEGDDTNSLFVIERLTQQDLANRVGASREMVSRILRDLDRGGYIRQENGRIVIDRPPPARW